MGRRPLTPEEQDASKKHKQKVMAKYFAEHREKFKPKADYSTACVFKIVNPATGECFVDSSAMPTIEKHMAVSRRAGILWEHWGKPEPVVLQSGPFVDRRHLNVATKEWSLKEERCINKGTVLGNGFRVKKYVTA